MPPDVRRGRGLLFDARLSGNGTMSCASCHLDADRDGLVWDLGNPGGDTVPVTSADLSIHDFTLFQRFLHPMKGPLLTQTIHGLALNDARPSDPSDGATRPPAAIVTKFHWRGDKSSIQSFNSTYPKLMGGLPQPAHQPSRRQCLPRADDFQRPPREPLHRLPQLQRRNRPKP